MWLEVLAVNGSEVEGEGSNDVPDESYLTYPASISLFQCDFSLHVRDGTPHQLCLTHRKECRKLVFRLKWAESQEAQEVMTYAIAYKTVTLTDGLPGVEFEERVNVISIDKDTRWSNGNQMMLYQGVISAAVIAGTSFFATIGSQDEAEVTVNWTET